MVATILLSGANSNILNNQGRLELEQTIIPDAIDIANLNALYAKMQHEQNLRTQRELENSKNQATTVVFQETPAPQTPEVSVIQESNKNTPTENQPISRSSSLLYILDNRIIPEQVGFRDKLNKNIWLHPRDIAEESRLQALHDKLVPLMSMPYPSYHETEVRKPFIEAIRKTLTKNPNLSDVLPEKSPYPDPIKTSKFNAPLAHIVNGEPFPKLLTEAEQQIYRDANIIYLMLEYKLASKNVPNEHVGGYPDLLQDTVGNLKRRGIIEPSIDQLIHEIRDALGISTAQFVRTSAEHGIEGIAELLKIDKPLLNEITELMDYAKLRSFPLNDIINWEYGRKITAPNSDIGYIIDKGKEERITQTITAYQNSITEFAGAVPNQLKNEMLLASSLDLVPPLVRELFFQIGGQIITTQESDLYNVIDQPATGFHLSFNDNANLNNSLNQIFISGDLGLPRTNRTIVHEMHHMLFPNHISPEEAIHADTLLNRDEVRLNIFKDLSDRYADAVVKGDIAEQNRIIESFDSPEYAVNGKRFSEMLESIPSEIVPKDKRIKVFLGALNEAYQYLQLEAPSYNRIGAYQEALTRYREIIPRFAEIKFVEFMDRPEILEFIVPNISEIYNDVYMPHLQRKLDFLYANQPIKADLVLAKQDAKLEAVANEKLGGWDEYLNGGSTIISHPKGDENPVSFAGKGTPHVSVQNYNVKQNKQANESLVPLMQIESATAQTKSPERTQPTIIIG